MAEISRYWGGIVVGDCGPYTDDNYSDEQAALFTTDRTTQGVIRGFLNTLTVTGAASPVSIATGRAIVDGKTYYLTAGTTMVIPSPAVNPRIDRIVLRKDWAAQTVRLTRVAGVEGGGAPALTQVDGNTWDIPLYQASITVGGVITLTDERYYCQTPLSAVDLEQFLDINTTPFAFSNSNAEQTIYSFSIPGGTIGTNNIVKLIVMGDYKATAPTDVHTVRFKYGATTIMAPGISPGTTTTAMYKFTFYLKGDGATNAQYAVGDRSSATMGFGTAAEDSTAAKNIIVTWQFGTASVNNYVNHKMAILEVYTNY